MKRGLVRLIGIALAIGGFALTSKAFVFGHDALVFVFFVLGVIAMGIGIWLNLVPIRDTASVPPKHDAA